MGKILIHVCCAPCLAYLHSYFHEKYEIVCYFYNPNISPFQEFQKRKDALKIFCEKNHINIIFEENYDFENWLDFLSEIKSFPELKQDKKNRCEKCYEIRLLKTIEKAKQLNIKIFTTSLLYSIYQDNEGIKKLGEKLAENSTLDFYYKDFRENWKEGCEIYKNTGLYRQNYCGCIFSEHERFGKKLIRK